MALSLVLAGASWAAWLVLWLIVALGAALALARVYVVRIAPWRARRSGRMPTPAHADVHPLLRRSATQLAQLLREGKVTSVKLVQLSLAQLKAVDPYLNAVRATREAKALDEARRADAIYSAWRSNPAGATLPLFLGVPCSIKEAYAVEGMPQSSGLHSRRELIATADATAVKRLRDGGFIVIGVTNTSELCMWYETNNKVHGRTNNPYDITRTPGGSSGGEGAVLGAAVVPVGLGSDVGGSIRMPCFFNGVFGHKSTGGMVPNTGHYPLAEGPVRRYNCLGPMCQKAEDLWPMLQLLRGPDGVDGGVLPELATSKLSPNAVQPSSVNVFFSNVNNAVPFHVSKVDPQLAKACSLAAAALAEETRNKMQLVPLPEWSRCGDMWSACMAAAGGKSFHELLANGQELRIGAELLKAIAGHSNFTIPGLGLAWIERIPHKLAPQATFRLVDATREFKKRLLSVLGENGILIVPTHPKLAPLHNEPLFRPFNFMFTGIFNVLEFPVTQVPLGLSREGLPMGCQVVSAPGNDHLTIWAAQVLERKFGGWVPPSVALVAAAPQEA